MPWFLDIVGSILAFLVNSIIFNTKEISSHISNKNKFIPIQILSSKASSVRGLLICWLVEFGEDIGL